jgi:hypothetical protein
MSRFREEMKVVAPGMWALAAVLFVVTAIFGIQLTRTPEAGQWPDIGKVVFVCVLPSIIFCYTVLVGYVFRDAKRRGMRHVMWTLLAIFIPNAIGFILYFILRQPLVESCRACGAAVSARFSFCPKCDAPRTQVCSSCKSVVEPGWTHCATCGGKL